MKLPDDLRKKVTTFCKIQGKQLYRKVISKGVLAEQLLLIPAKHQDINCYMLPFQKRIWPIKSPSDSQKFHNITIALRLCGNLDVDRFFSRQQVSDKHSAPKIYIKVDDGKPLQIVLPNITVGRNFQDFRSYDSSDNVPVPIRPSEYNFADSIPSLRAERENENYYSSRFQKLALVLNRQEKRL